MRLALGVGHGKIGRGASDRRRVRGEESGGEQGEMRRIDEQFCFHILFSSDVRCDGFEFFQDDAFGEQFRKQNRFRDLARVKHIHWDTGTAKLFQNFCDRRIGVGPIGFDFDDAVTLKGIAHGAGFRERSLR